MWNREPIGGPFALIDQTASRAPTRTSAASCCWSISASPIARTSARPTCRRSGWRVDQLGAAGEAVQPLFITVDPERDTAEHLKDYVPMFHPRLVGLTGDAAAITPAAARLRVYYAKVADQGRRLHRRPLRLHLSDGSGRRISRLFSARHAAGTHAKSIRRVSAPRPAPPSPSHPRCPEHARGERLVGDAQVVLEQALSTARR